MKKINEKIKKALSFLLILTMAMTSVGVSTLVIHPNMLAQCRK